MRDETASDLVFVRLLLRGVLRVALSLSILLLSTAPRARAEVIEETETKRTERQLEIDVAIQSAAQQAEARKELETGETVTYEQVLKDPDNLDLNFRYAKAQMARGDLVGASATLERILMINPDLPPIRLFYALVLFRLDNLEEAQQEFTRLKDEGKLPDPQRRQVEQYLQAIRQRHRRTHFVASTSLGWGWERNRNAAASSKKRLLADTLLDLTGTNRRRSDTNTLVVSSLEVAHELGERTGHLLTGSLDYYLGEQTWVDDLDLQSFSAESGAVVKTPLARLRASGAASYLYLGRETFLRSQGAKWGADRPIGDRFTLAVNGSWMREDYQGITENTTAPDRTGDRITTNVAGQYALTQTMIAGLDLGYENKDVRGPAQYNAYQEFGLTGSHTWLLGRGQFLLNSLEYVLDTYDVPDTSISATKRLDRQLRYRVTYGAPVTFLIGAWLPEAVTNDLTATFSAEQFRSHSTVTNYSYSNTKLGLLLTKRVEF
ncbi:MAG: tetratricopeptide repeat protein [Candidatus Omnitrophica bacterium]|nr:tetratricopeptide repeat protein [Candidatus Omnitrophota bacterium]